MYEVVKMDDESNTCELIGEYSSREESIKIAEEEVKKLKYTFEYVQVTYNNEVIWVSE